MAVSPKVSHREAKAAKTEAEVVIRSLSHAGDAAIARTLQDISDRLRSNVPLLYHIGALLNNSEWTAVLEASIAGHEATCGDKQAPPRKQWKLRVDAKKFTHLDKRVCK